MALKHFLIGVNQILDDVGDPLSGGQVYFFEPGTSNAFTSYTDSGLGTANAHPVVLGSDGRPPNSIWLSGDCDTRVDDSDDNVIWSEDNINPDVPERLLPGLITGLVPTQDTDTINDILISSGLAMDASDSAFIELTTEITKQIDATWTEGDDLGGLFSGVSLSVDTWYHLFVIRNPSTEVVDAGFDTSITAANIPSGYTQYRRVGSVFTNGSSEIIDFIADATNGGGVNFRWDINVNDVLENDPGITVQTVTATVPDGVRVEAEAAWFIVDGSSSASIYLIVTEVGQTDTNPLAGQGMVALGTGTVGDVMIANAITRTWTDTSQSLNYRIGVSDAGVTVYMNTTGWVDHRR